MNKHHIYARLTHKYRTGWSHLDRHEYVFDLKLTPRKVSHLHDDGAVDHILYGRISAKQREQARKVWESLPRRDRGLFKHWLCRTISGEFVSGCQCEHDCCGHYQSYAATAIHGRLVVVRVHSYPNL